MSDNSKIEWTSRTWNPILGCDKVSPGCDRCYAIVQARIRASNPNPKVAGAFEGLTHRTESGIDWTGRVNLLHDRLLQPLRWRKPETVFLNSLSDLFHKNVPDDFILQVFAVMAVTPRHTYQALTKRHGRMRSLLNRESFAEDVRALAWSLEGHSARRVQWPLPNVHLGVSAESQHWLDIRVPALLQTPAAVRWVSAEPLIGPLSFWPEDHEGHDRDDIGEFGGWTWTCLDCSGPEDENPRIPWKTYDRSEGIGVDWVVAGGESGPGARRCELEWLRTLRDECAAANVPFFAKQLGSVLGRELGAGSKGGDMDHWPEDLKIREFPRMPEMTGAA
jgi:protein gp37